MDTLSSSDEMAKALSATYEGLVFDVRDELIQFSFESDRRDVNWFITHEAIIIGDLPADDDGEFQARVLKVVATLVDMAKRTVVLPLT